MALRLRHQAFSNAWKQWRSQRGGGMAQTFGECLFSPINLRYVLLVYK